MAIVAGNLIFFPNRCGPCKGEACGVVEELRRQVLVHSSDPKIGGSAASKLSSLCGHETSSRELVHLNRFAGSLDELLLAPQVTFAAFFCDSRKQDRQVYSVDINGVAHGSAPKIWSPYQLRLSPTARAVVFLRAVVHELFQLLLLPLPS